MFRTNSGSSTPSGSTATYLTKHPDKQNKLGTTGEEKTKSLANYELLNMDASLWADLSKLRSIKSVRTLDAL